MEKTPVPLVLAFIALTAACAAIHRPPATIASLEATADADRTLRAATTDALIDALACRLQARADHTVDILLLSGGGQNGAYGAGFLRGWKSRTDAPMPRFDLVTGVSAGALQAPFALLGTAEAIDRSAYLFRNAAKEFAPTFDWWFWLRRTGGIANTSRYRKTVTREFSADLQTKLTAEFHADRRLVVATTDLDLGIGRAWDLAPELSTTPEGLARARQLLLASSAIPGVFPPVVVDGHVHSDGGIVSNVYIPLEFADYQRLMTRVRAEGLDGEITVRVWVVMNLWAYPRVDVTDPANRGDISSRAGTLLFASQQPQIIDHLEDLARAVSSGISGMQLEVRATAIPQNMATEPGADKLFDDAWMRRLEQFGYDRARGASSWDTFIVPYARPPH